MLLKIIQRYLILLWVFDFVIGRCPANSYRSKSGICDCKFDHVKINVTGGTGDDSIKCQECIPCNGFCMGRTLDCYQKHAYPVNSEQGCSEPKPGQFLTGYDISPCRQCGNNEQVVQQCKCYEDRVCDCRKGYHRDGNNQCIITIVPESTVKHKPTANKPPPESRSKQSSLLVTVISCVTVIVLAIVLAIISNLFGRNIVAFIENIRRRKKKNTDLEASYEGDGRSLGLPDEVSNHSSENTELLSMQNVTGDRDESINHDDGIPVPTNQTNDTNSETNDFEQIIGKVNEANLDLLIDNCLIRYYNILEIPCTKAEKDAYINIAFKGDEDMLKIIKGTDKENGCDYIGVMNHVKTRKPRYTLKDLLKHMHESGNHSLVEILVKEILKDQGLKKIQIQN